MIASLRGEVLSLGLDTAVIAVGGVGLNVQATPATVASFRVGQEAMVYTVLVVREDSLSLYGFADDDERKVFEALLSVSGVGPRLALASLAVLTPNSLRRAVQDEDQGALTRIPGVGKKGAARMILELGDRLGPPSESGGVAVSPSRPGAYPDVVDALVGLGWNVKAAEAAVESVVADPSNDTNVAEVLRAALRTLGGSAR